MGRKATKEELDRLNDLHAKIDLLNAEYEIEIKKVRMACGIPVGATLDRFTGQWGRLVQTPQGQAFQSMEELTGAPVLPFTKKVEKQLANKRSARP